MKKIISVMLLFVMLFSLTAVAAPKETQTSTLSQEIIEFYKAFRFFDMEKDENEPMTRAEFAQVVSNILSYHEASANLSLGDIVVEDLENAEEYEAAVINVVRFGYMQGAKVGENTFRFNPKQEITPTEIIKVLVDLLGYKEYVAYKGGYPTGYLNVANSLGILKGVSLSLNKTATIGTAMKLTFNALNTEVAQVGIQADSLTIKNTKGETYLSERFKIKRFDGVLKANSMIHITGQKTTVGNYVNIDDTVYRSQNAYENFTYIGRYVRAYLDTYSSEDGEIVCMYPVENKGRSYTIPLKDFENAVKFDKLTSEDGKTDYDINRDASVFYNFNYLGPVRSFNYSTEEVTSVISMIGKDLSAEIVLTDNDGDGSADFVWVRSYDNMLVKSFVYDTFKLNGAYNDTMEMRTAFDNNKVFFYDTDGNTFNPKNFEKDDVVSLITKSDASGKVEAALGIVSKLSVRGVITEISEDGLLIGDALYQPSAEYAEQLAADSQKVERLEAGLETLFYINKFGMIVGINQSETVEGGEKTLAFLYKVNKADGMAGEISAMVYGTDGEKSVIPFDTTVRINAVSKKSDAIYTELNNIAEVKGDKNCIVYRLVKYQLKDKKISAIDIYAYQTRAYNEELAAAGKAHEGDRDSEFYPYLVMNSSEASANTVFKANTFGKRIGVTNDTTILAVPSLINGVDFSILDDDAFYTVKYSDLNGDSIFGDSQYSATTNASGLADNPIQMAFYDVDNTLFSGLAIKYYKYVSGGVNVSPPDLLSDGIIVEEIVKGLNKDDDNVLILYGMQKGTPVRIQSAPIDASSNVWSEYPALKYLLQDASKRTAPAGEIKPGDAIQVLFNSKGEMINALVLMRAANKDSAAWLIKDAPAGTSLSKLNQGQGNEYLGINYGTIVEYSDGKLVLDELDGVQRVYLLGTTTITSYNRTTKKVAKASNQDLEIGKQIFIRQYYSGIKEAVYYID